MKLASLIFATLLHVAVAYSQIGNPWAQKADFGGNERQGAVGFSIGSKGYIGTGWNGNGNGYKDFWEYSPEISPLIPANLSAINITSSSAKLKWDTVAGAEGYKIRYKISGTGAWTKTHTASTSKTIGGLSSNTKYTWQLRTLCQVSPNILSDWSAKQSFTTGVLRMGDESPQQVSLQIYPNPAEDFATIQFTLQQASFVSVSVYDVSGKEILVVRDEELQQGEHSFQLNTSEFAKGVYFVKMISDKGIENQKLIVQ